MNYKFKQLKYSPLLYLSILLLANTITLGNPLNQTLQPFKGGFDLVCPEDTILKVKDGRCSVVYTFATPTIEETNSSSNEISPLNKSSVNTGTITKGPTLEANSSGNWAGVAYNPNLNIYYAGRAGGLDFMLNTYSANGTILHTTTGGSDFRGFWWNYCVGALWGDGYNNFGYFQVDLNHNGYATAQGKTIVPNKRQPDEQSAGDYDALADELVFYDTGSIYRYHPASGAFLGSYPIKNLPVDTRNITKYTIGYTGVPNNEFVLYDYIFQRVYFINKNTGAYSTGLQLPDSTARPQEFGFSYSNGYIFLRQDASSQSWQSYKVVNNHYHPKEANCSPNVVQTEGPKSGEAFPVGTTTIEFTATDSEGNMGTCSYTVTVTEGEAPTTVCKNITVQLDANGHANITTNDINNRSFDNCGIATMTLDKTEFDCTMIGANTVTLSIEDNSGNLGNCTAIVTVESGGFCD